MFGANTCPSGFEIWGPVLPDSSCHRPTLRKINTYLLMTDVKLIPKGLLLQKSINSDTKLPSRCYRMIISSMYLL